MDDLDQLLAKSLEAVRRDLNHIFGEVSGKKLTPTSARDLVSYVKLLSEAKDAEAVAAKAAKKLSTEELEKLASELLNAKT